MEAGQQREGRSWKRLAIRAVVGGFGFGVGAALVLLVVVWYSERPKSWRTDALRVKQVVAGSFVAIGENLEEKSSGTIFTIDLENTTDGDITLSQTLTVMQSAKETGALHGSLLKPGRDYYFIPAHHVVSVSLENDDLCAGNTDPQECFDSYFKDQSAIVVFDDAHKYEVRIAVPAFTPPKPAPQINDSVKIP